MSADVFSSLVTDKDRLDNLTSSINSYYTDGIINGIEIDWEWPVQDGGKKDRVKLIRYARVIEFKVWPFYFYHFMGSGKTVDSTAFPFFSILVTVDLL